MSTIQLSRQISLFEPTIGQLNAVGWELPRIVDQEQWRNAGYVLTRLDNASQWWKGDWWNAGVAWGEGQAVCEELGLSYQTIMDCGMVARAFQFSRRRENLGFTHHREVLAVKEPNVQDRFLAWCEEPLANGGKTRSTRELREQIKTYLDEQSWTGDQQERRKLVAVGSPVLANLKDDAQLIQWAEFQGLLTRIDRQSKWGNPFEVGKDGDRDYVVESYRLYLDRKRSLHADIAELDGKVLACWCYPQLCHGSVLMDWLVKQTAQERH